MQNEEESSNFEGTSSKKLDPQKVWDSFSPHSKVGRNEKKLDQEANAWLLNVAITILIVVCGFIIGKISDLFSPASGGAVGGFIGCIVAMIYYGISSVLVELNRNLRRIADSLHNKNTK